MIRLLDVNVLLALVDPDSLHHERAHLWITQKGNRFQWASCALTENGFCRIISSPSYSGAVTPRQAVHLLSGLRLGLAGHSFWPCEISIADDRRFQWELVQGPKQLTDLYLVALAIKHRARLATFDRRIRWAAVQGATEETIETI